jgi:hypothetical protein
VPLAGPDDGEAMATAGETVHEVAQRHGDAVDFG